MHALLLTIAIGIAPDCIWSNQLPPPTTKAKPKHAALPAGWHTHRCLCGQTWSHGAEWNGNVAAHRCPNCGRIVWQKSPTMTIRTAPPNCPNGRCPIR